MFFLADGDIAVLTAKGVRVMDHDGRLSNAPPTMSPGIHHGEKGGYKHFMQKEIFEQPRAVRDTLLGRISQDTGKVSSMRWPSPKNSSANFSRSHRRLRHKLARRSGAKFMIERLARLQVESGLRQRIPLSRPHRRFENADRVHQPIRRNRDTLAAQREAKSKGSPSLAICNVIGSMITREANGTIPTHAGPEIGVASTKAFTSQLTALLLLASYLGQVRGTLGEDAARTLMQEFTRIPHKIETVLQADESGFYENLARQFFRYTRFSLSRQGHSLPDRARRRSQLKEISYIHAEGYPAGEMKHGPNALIDENLPVVVLATRDESDPKP